MRRMFQKLYSTRRQNNVLPLARKEQSDLLPVGNDGDSYQALKEQLAGLWENRVE